MGGICGIVETTGAPLRTGDLEPMFHTMAHRGPDGRDSWSEGSAAMGQLALHTTPQSRQENLPWRHAESSLVITADARIDNRDELLNSFRLSPDSQIGDGQLILRAFLAWGVDCVQRMVGDFSFAIWDPGKRTLFCARDHLGSRPFYYSFLNNRFVFASSAPGVSGGLKGPVRLNEERVLDYLFHEIEGIDHEVTFFRNIYRLPPATCLTLCCGKMVTHGYWKTDSITELRLQSDGAYQEALGESFCLAVSRCMRADIPVASMLSGGVDSSAIVAMAAKLRDSGHSTQSSYLSRTVSQVNDDEDGCVESECIRAVAKHTGVKAELMDSAVVEEYANELGHWSESMEDPFDSGMIQRFLMYQSASRFGHRVVFDGVDGDVVASLPGGYPRFLVRSGEPLKAFREVIGQRKLFQDQSTPFWRPPLSLVWSSVAPRPLLAKRIKRGMRHFVELQSSMAMINPELAEREGLQERYERYVSTLEKSGIEHNRKGGLRSAHAERVRVPFLTAAVERYERVAASSSIESRHPLLDRQFVEHCISLPWEQLSRQGWSKYGFRRFAATLLPQKVAWRRDNGTLDWLYLAKWLDLSRTKMAEQLLDNSDSLSDWINWPDFSTRIQQYILKPDLSTDYLVWRIYCLHSWLNRHF